MSALAPSFWRKKVTNYIYVTIKTEAETKITKTKHRFKYLQNKNGPKRLPFKVYLFSNYAGYLSTFSLQDRRTGSPSGILIIERHWPINSGQWPSMISISERLPASYPSTEELSSPADSVHTQIILGYIRIYYDILAYARIYSTD